MKSRVIRGEKGDVFVKTYLVTFERTVQIEVDNDADLNQIKAAAVEMYNDPPSFEDMYLTKDSITSIEEEVFEIG